MLGTLLGEENKIHVLLHVAQGKHYDAYKNGKGSDAAKYLELFHGITLIIDRKGNGPLHIPYASASICGGIQPGVLRKCLDPKLFENGFDTKSPIIKEVLRKYKGIVGDPIETYKKICPGAPALVFTSNKEEADRWAGKFREAGYNFIALYSGMSAGYIFSKIDEQT